MLKDLKLAFFLAYKSIFKGNIMTLFFITLVMIFSFSNIILVHSLIDGIDDLINGQVIENKFGDIVIEPIAGENEIKNSNSIHEKISLLEEVKGISSKTIKGITLEFKDKKFVGNSYFINPNNEKQVTQIHNNMVEGEFLSNLDKDEILIGNEIAGTYGPLSPSKALDEVKAGDKIKVIFSNGLVKEYHVKGIINTKFFETDSEIFFNYKEYKSVFNEEQKINQINIKLKENTNQDLFIEKLRIMGISDKITKSNELSGISITLTETFKTLKTILVFIAGAVSIATLFIVVYINIINRRRLIGITKAIGVKSKIIIYSYMFQSSFYAINGIIVGTILLFTVYEPLFKKYPLSMPFGHSTLLISNVTLIETYILFIVISLIAGFIPAYIYTNKNLIDIIRGRD